MINQRYTPEFKDEAVRQVVERGDRVAEVAERLGVSTNSLHKWVKAAKPSKADAQGVSGTDLLERFRSRDFWCRPERRVNWSGDKLLVYSPNQPCFLEVQL